MPRTPDNQQVALVPSVRRTKAGDITLISLTDFIATVKSDKYKQRIEQLRIFKISDPAKYRAEKLKLPAVAFGAYDGDSGIESKNYRPNSLCVFNADVDGLKNLEHVNILKELVECHPAVVFCFVSPSGLGLKIGFYVSPIKDDPHFKIIFTYIEKWIKEEIHSDLILDKSCKDIRRLCFVSYDPLAYVNLKADVLPTPTDFNVVRLNTSITPDIQAVTPCIDVETATLTTGLYSVENEIFAVVSNMMLKATAGNRHGVRLAAGRLIGGYIAGGLIDETKARELITALSDQIAEGGCTSDSELQTITDAITEGQKTPLTLEDFRKAHGYNVAVFDPAVVTAAKELHLTKNTKGTRILATLDNIHQALSTPAFSGYRLGFDSFKDQMMYHTTTSPWLPFEDETYTQLRIQLPKLSFEEIPAPIMRDAVNYSARQNKFDSAQEWLKALEWDGAQRVKDFNARYFKTVDNPYTAAISLYLWTALVARVLDAGCQCDMVVVYEGLQGDGKSSAVAAIAPRADMATEISFLDDEDKSARKMQGCVICEISELRGINTKDEESIKAFITRRYDRWVPKYKEFAVEIPRRSIFVGTTNKKEFLADPTGQRRWLPISCGKVDVAGIVKDRDQLWAEAAVIYKQQGICWQDAERLAVDEHEDFMLEDTWSGPIKTYLKLVAEQKLDQFLTSASILYGALKIEPCNHQMRVTAVLKLLGFNPERGMLGGERVRYWRK